MTVMIVIVMMTTAIHRRRGFLAVLTLGGHAQLLRRFRAEFSYRTCTIAVRHLLRIRKGTLFATMSITEPGRS